MLEGENKKEKWSSREARRKRKDKRGQEETRGVRKKHNRLKKAEKKPGMLGKHGED